MNNLLRECLLSALLELASWAMFFFFFPTLCRPSGPNIFIIPPFVYFGTNIFKKISRKIDITCTILRHNIKEPFWVSQGIGCKGKIQNKQQLIWFGITIKSIDPSIFTCQRLEVD
uniref:Uncharacterized protein n=1 Tax=Rhizophora mucronata TaxID=61149 RepID=A0A2P2P0A5_RHIMU